jgi:general secretion pathway protein A
MQMISSIDIYNDFFGLTERPFSLVPDPDFLFWSDQHKRAYTMLEYGLMTGAPITLITGEVGAGKTTLVHHLLKQLPLEMTVGLISNAQGDRGKLVRWVLMALDQEAPTNEPYVDLFNRLQTFLIDEYAAGPARDPDLRRGAEPQPRALEELRMFTNINSNKDELVHLVLVGQPELRDIIRRPDLKQFAQRVAASFHLKAMDAETGERLYRPPHEEGRRCSPGSSRIAPAALSTRRPAVCRGWSTSCAISCWSMPLLKDRRP